MLIFLSCFIHRRFDEIAMASAVNHYICSFTEHALRVTDIVSGHGLSNSIMISSSEDRTCKVNLVFTLWLLHRNNQLRVTLIDTI